MYGAAGGAERERNGASMAAIAPARRRARPSVRRRRRRNCCRGGDSLPLFPGLPPAPAYVAFKDAARRDMGRIRAAMAELRELHRAPRS